MHRYHEIQLVKKMLTASESIEWVVQCLRSGDGRVRADASGLNFEVVREAQEAIGEDSELDEKEQASPQIKLIDSKRMDA